MGKTSLLRGLLSDCTPDPAVAGPAGRTIHVSIENLTLGHGGSSVTFACYDLGGQKRSYAAAQQAYIAPGALHLLVVSAEAATTEEHAANVSWWLHFLQTNAPGAVVQPILTHVDKCADATQADERAAWLADICTQHLARWSMAGASAPAPLAIQLDHIPRVNAAACPPRRPPAGRGGRGRGVTSGVVRFGRRTPVRISARQGLLPAGGLRLEPLAPVHVL